MTFALTDQALPVVEPTDPMKPVELRCSVGVMAFKEEANIAKCLNSLLNQEANLVRIEEIVVVVSGNADNTGAIVEDFSQRDPRVRLLTQTHREGKASAINLFLSRSRASILVMVGADTILPSSSLGHLLLPFLDPEVGMTGGHPIPVNDPRTFMGFTVHLLWDLHHRVALRHPKPGELTAYRRIFERIPRSSAVDEANIEPLVRGQGYEIRYVPQAILLNRGPSTVADFLKQRRRINAGHYRLRRAQGYTVATMSGRRIFLELIRHPQWNWRWWLWTPAVIGLEIWGRALGWYDYRWANRSHTVWDVVASTKEVG